MLQQNLNQFIMKKITINLIVAVFAIISFGHRAIAQEKSKSQTTIKIIKSENGKITKSEKVIEGEPNGSIQELFEENGILDEINFTNEETDRFHKMVFISKDDENQDTKAFLGIYGMPGENIKIINDNGNIEVINEEPEDSKVDETIGVEITGIVSDSPAEKAGLLKGDIITKINSNKINSFENLKTELSKLEVGEQITVSYLREGKKNEASGELKSRADSKSIESFVKSYRFDFDEDNNHQNGFFSDEIRINISINNISKEEAKNLKKSTGLDLNENDLEFEEFSFAPNPTSGVFQVSFTPQLEGKIEISLLDQSGKQVYLHNLNAQKQKYIEEINISERANGIYFLVINQNNKIFSKKVIKQ